MKPQPSERDFTTPDTTSADTNSRCENQNPTSSSGIRPQLRIVPEAAPRQLAPSNNAPAAGGRH